MSAGYRPTDESALTVADLSDEEREAYEARFVSEDRCSHGLSPGCSECAAEEVMGYPAPPPPRVEVTDEMTWKALETFRSTPGEKMDAMRAALEAALSTQDQAQGSRARSAHSQPSGAQVDPASSAPTPPDDDQMSEIIKRAADAVGPHESSVVAAINAVWLHGYAAALCAQPVVRPRVTVEEIAKVIESQMWTSEGHLVRHLTRNSRRNAARAILKLFGEG